MVGDGSCIAPALSFVIPGGTWARCAICAASGRSWRKKIADRGYARVAGHVRRDHRIPGWTIY